MEDLLCVGLQAASRRSPVVLLIFHSCLADTAHLGQMPDLNAPVGRGLRPFGDLGEAAQTADTQLARIEPASADARRRNVVGGTLSSHS